MKTKNTRLIYTDEKNLKAYESLPSDDFKEFFMTYLTYQDGDDVSKTISNPFVQTLFMAAYADKITHNEEKWEKKAKTNRENGQKGGRPKKNNTDIQPNNDFDKNFQIRPNKPLNSENDTEIPQEEESVLNRQEVAKNEELENNNQDNTENNMKNFISIYDKPISRQDVTKDVGKTEIEPQTTDLSDNFDNYSGTLNDFLDENENIIRRCTDIIARSVAVPSGATDSAADFYKVKINNLLLMLKGDDATNFQQFVDKEINRKAEDLKYERRAG